MTMGGRVAEELVFNQRTTGAANDLEVATRMAKRMVREWGMSDRIGPMAWESQGQVFLGEDLMTGPARVLRRHRPPHRRGGGPHPARAGGPGPVAAHEAPPRAGPGGLRRCWSTRRSTAPRSPQLVQDGLSPEPAPPPRPPAQADRQPDRPAARRPQRPRPGSGDEPGWRSSATAAHRSVAEAGPMKLAPTTPPGIGHHHDRDGLDGVLAVQRRAAPSTSTHVDRDLSAGQHGRLVGHGGAGVAGRRREDRHQVGRVRPGEVGPVQLRRRLPTAGSGVGAGRPLGAGAGRRHRRRPTAASARASSTLLAPLSLR